MASTALSPIYDELLEYLVQKATPQEILAFHLSETAQERAEYLTERNKSGMLTSEEKLELEQMIESKAGTFPAACCAKSDGQQGVHRLR